MFQPKDTPFEFKLNMTETDLVVVEDAKLFDTNAVILKVIHVLCEHFSIFSVIFHLICQKNRKQLYFTTWKSVIQFH